MTKLLIGLSLGTAMAIGAAQGVAQAEPVTLTVAQMDQVTAAGWRHKASGEAIAEADADAFGRRVFTATFTDADVVCGRKACYAESTSASAAAASN